MFEDSTFESAGRIHTASRRWMIASFAFYASIVLACVVIPLMFPEALPILGIPILVAVPAPLSNPQTPKTRPSHAPATQPTPTWTLTIPTVIPRFILTPSAPEPQIITALDEPNGIPGGIPTVLPLHAAPIVVQSTAKPRLRISSMDEEVRLIHQTKPAYPPIAVATRTEGTVILAATISKTGSIENLRVTSGPALLQKAALDAVETWRYQPYLLDGEPVEVETTVSVTFTLGR
ncbi:MAG: TonB family protein [Terracidiphilus sp.]